MTREEISRLGYKIEAIFGNSKTTNVTLRYRENDKKFFVVGQVFEAATSEDYLNFVLIKPNGKEMMFNCNLEHCYYNTLENVIEKLEII